MSDRPIPGPDVLVVRAVFVPDGGSPPSEFASVFNPLRIPATYDPGTGELTGTNQGSFGPGIRATWNPDVRDDAATARDQGV